MPEDTIVVLALLFFLVGALYSSVGHAGASGYLAVMSLMGVDTYTMRPIALAINILVATIAFVHFARAGHFSWRTFWPFSIASVPAAYFGGSLHLPSRLLQLAIGAVLLLSAARLGWTALHPPVAPVAPIPPPQSRAIVTGGAIGFVSGLTGTGGGILLSPLMLFFNWADTRRTAATASLFILVNSVAGLGGIVSSGWMPGPGLALLAAAACLGGVIGSRYGSRRATPRMLRLLLVGVLALAGGKLVLA